MQMDKVKQSLSTLYNKNPEQKMDRNLGNPIQSNKIFQCSGLLDHRKTLPQRRENWKECNLRVREMMYTQYEDVLYNFSDGIDLKDTIDWAYDMMEKK